MPQRLHADLSALTCSCSRARARARSWRAPAAAYLFHLDWGEAGATARSARLCVFHQPDAVARFLHVGALQQQGNLLVKLRQLPTQRGRDVLQPQAAHRRIGFKIGHQLAQLAHKHRRPQRVLLHLHRIQANQRTHARVQHRQHLLHHRQQVLQQAHRLQRLAHLHVINQFQHGGVGQTSEAGHALLRVGLREGFAQALRVGAGQRAAVL